MYKQKTLSDNIKHTNSISKPASGFDDKYKVILHVRAYTLDYVRSDFIVFIKWQSLTS